MSATVIVLIIIGLIFIFVSFMISEKLSEDQEDKEGVIKIPEELSEEQKEKIDKLIRDYMDSQTEDRLTEIETRLSEIVNQKTLALGDYAVTVNEEIERNHKEVVFLYDMLSEKQKEIMTSVNMVDEYKKDIATMIQHGTVQTVLNQNQQQEKENRAEETKEAEPVSEEQELEEVIREVEETPIPEETEKELENVDNKEMILEMHRAGLSILEIAKHLGLGVGEVKLVVDLYQGESK